MTALLSVSGLSVGFGRKPEANEVVHGVSFALADGETLAIVGESGSGKSVTALSINRLVDFGGGHIIRGSIKLRRADGSVLDLATASEAQLTKVRGAEIGMIFQEPMTSLNPVMRVGMQVAEPLMLHSGLTKRQALSSAAGHLARVGLPDPERTLAAYPHELSGGMRQRVMIAMALACGPKLLIADEPTTALDVTIQKQILELMDSLARGQGLSMLLITHNLGVVARTCDRVGVMYAGRLVELCTVQDLFAGSLHPYTQGLMASLPRLGSRHVRLKPIEGAVPPLTALPPGCHFHPRCPHAFEPCAKDIPPIFRPAPGREVRCWLHAGEAAA